MREDVDALRESLIDLCGTAAAAGFGPALLGVADIESAGPEELLRIASSLSVDPGAYETR